MEIIKFSYLTKLSNGLLNLSTFLNYLIVVLFNANDIYVYSNSNLELINPTTIVSDVAIIILFKIKLF